MPRTDQPRPRALPVVVAALACLLTVVAGPPAEARPGAAKWPWVTVQKLQPNGKVTVRLEWKKVARAKKYRISYAPLAGRLNPGEVARSRKKKVKTVRRDRGPLQEAVVRNLKPGRIYCFQVQGVRRKTSGRSSGVHCKATTRISRPRPPGGTDLAIATFNTCSTACIRQLGTSWETVRGPLVERRVQEVRAGSSTGRLADVVAVQEGNHATPYLTGRLADTFARGCQTGDGIGDARGDNQSVFVRTTTWSIVQGTAGGLNFVGDGSHGACWVKIRSKATGREVVVVSLHLYAHSTDAGDRFRRAQTKAVVGSVNAAHPRATVVYAGDFNSYRGRKRDQPHRILSPLGYDDAFDPALSFHSHPHFTSLCETFRRPRTSPTWAGQLDRVFVPRGVHVSSWKVDYRMSGRKYVAPFASDHNPVVVGLVLPR